MAIVELLGWGQRTCDEALVASKSARGRAAASVTRGVGSRDATVWSESGQWQLRWRCLRMDENKAFREEGRGWHLVSWDCETSVGHQPALHVQARDPLG